MKPLVFFACATLSGCTTILPDAPEEVPAEAIGARPIYLDSAAARTVTAGPELLPERWRDELADVLRDLPASASLPAVTSGRLLVDTLYGLYVLPLADTSAALDSTSYVRVWGITEAQVTGVGEVRVSSFEDAVTLRFVDVDSVAVVARERGQFAYPAIDPRFELSTRDGRISYFECYDPALGFFGGWEAATLTRPQCLARWRW